MAFDRTGSISCLLATGAWLLWGSTAAAGDVSITPTAGNSFIVKDAGNAHDRLRVKESGEVSIAVLVGGPQQDSPVCFGTGGIVGPCAPGTPTGGGGTLTLPFLATLSDPGDLFSIVNSGAGGAIYGIANNLIGVQGFSSSFNGVHGHTNSASGGGAGLSGVNDSSGAGISGKSSGGDGVFGVTQAGNGGNKVGVRGAGSGSSWGVFGSSDTGNGVFGISQGTGVWGESTGEGDSADGVHGHTNTDTGKGSGVAGFNDGGGAGVFGISQKGDGAQGVSTSATASGVFAANTGSGYGVFATSASGFAIYADGPTTQQRDQGGMLKALITLTYTGTEFVVDGCFNSQLPANIPQGPKCGFNFTNPSLGHLSIDFAFPVDDRFNLLTSFDGTIASHVSATSGSLLSIEQRYSKNGENTNGSFTVAVF